MLSVVTVSPVITAFPSCCLSHHVFEPVNLWPDWVGFENAIFLQCSPVAVEIQRLYPLRHGPKFCRNVVKEETTQNYQYQEKKSAINKKLILRLRSLISK